MANIFMQILKFLKRFEILTFQCNSAQLSVQHQICDIRKREISKISKSQLPMTAD